MPVVVGTDMGPSALRIAGLGAAIRDMGYSMAREEDIAVSAMETRSIEDSEARFKPEILSVCTKLAERVKELMGASEFPLIIGGDHSIAMGTVSGAAAHFRDRDEEMGLIWFDAHGDMNIPGVSPSGNIHGMPLAHLLGRGDPDLAGILGFSPKLNPDKVCTDRNPWYWFRWKKNHPCESGIHVFTMRDIDELGMATVARRSMKIVTNGTAGFHVSFDVDGCDPAVMPGSGTLVPGGVRFREAHLLLEYCADTRHMTSMEVVELNPFLDQGNVSAERTLQLITSALGKSIL